MDHSSFLDLGRPGDSRERTAYFVLDALLRSRIECGFESNTDRYDEDVNVYLVDLLARLVSRPDFGNLAKERDIEVFEQVRGSSDPRFKSRVYRANADRLLVSTSLFVQSPWVEREGRREFDGAARDSIGRGKAYYHYAAAFQERLRSGSPVVARILGLLSEDFERWVEVLFHMRGEYFHLFERLCGADLRALSEPAPEGEGDVSPLEALRDEFLDAYWAWHQSPTASTRIALEDVVRRLRSADPEFRFELPQ